MRTSTGFMLLTAAVLLSGCVGGVVIPGWSDDKVSVDVDGVDPVKMQQMADTTCAERQNQRAKMTSNSMEPNGQRHAHYECVDKQGL